ADHRAGGDRPGGAAEQASERRRPCGRGGAALDAVARCGEPRAGDAAVVALSIDRDIRVEAHPRSGWGCVIWRDKKNPRTAVRGLLKFVFFSSTLTCRTR